MARMSPGRIEPRQNCVWKKPPGVGGEKNWGRGVLKCEVSCDWRFQPSANTLLKQEALQLAEASSRGKPIAILISNPAKARNHLNHLNHFNHLNHLNHLNHAWRIQHHPSPCCRLPQNCNSNDMQIALRCIARIQTLDHQNKPRLNIEWIYVTSTSRIRLHTSSMKCVESNILGRTLAYYRCNMMQLAHKLTLEPKPLTPPKPNSKFGKCAK